MFFKQNRNKKKNIIELRNFIMHMSFLIVIESKNLFNNALKIEPPSRPSIHNILKINMIKFMFEKLVLMLKKSKYRIKFENGPTNRIVTSSLNVRIRLFIIFIVPILRQISLGFAPK